MKKLWILALGLALWVPAAGGYAMNQFETDTFETDTGTVKITFVGHGTLMFAYNELVVHVDPWSKLADYSQMPKADVILVTHQHGDHLDPAAIQKLKKEETKVVITPIGAETVPGDFVLSNGDVCTANGLKIEAVPAYNLVHMRSADTPYHPKGEGNGYIITFGMRRVYVAGDTENIPEMQELENIDVAFLPMNLPYTMTPEMVADAARAFKPRILYPYHFGETDTNQLVELLEDQPDIEVRIRKMP